MISMKIKIYFIFLSVVILTSQCELKRTMKNKEEKIMFTQSDILKDLEDLYGPNYRKVFPAYGGPEFHMKVSSNKIHLYADEYRWAIVFETIGYSTPAGNIDTELIYFGNCLQKLDKTGADDQYITNIIFLQNLVTIDELNSISDSDGFELVSAQVKTIKIRNQQLPVEHDPKKYQDKGIEIFDYDNPKQLIDFTALTRYLNEEYPELFRATEEELKTCLPKDLPKLMSIDKWYHRDYFVDPSFPTPEPGSRPSEYETFPLIAEVLVSKDTTRWKPSLKPNNNWRNWE